MSYWIGTSHKPRDFEIQLQSNMDSKMYIETLLHELVHLRQWVHGTLTMKSGKFVWKGEDIHHIDYMNQPHEIEAFREEDGLLLMDGRVGNLNGQQILHATANGPTTEPEKVATEVAQSLIRQGADHLIETTP